jgi:hypothetical protein
MMGFRSVAVAANSFYEFFVAAPGPAGVAVNSGGSTTGSNHNALSVTGTLAIDPTTTFRINGNAVPFGFRQQFSYLIDTATSVSSPLNITDQSRFDTTNFTGFVAGTFSVQSVGGNVYLNFMPVPEPAGLAVATVGVGFTALIRWWRGLGAGCVAARRYVGRRRATA